MQMGVSKIKWITWLPCQIGTNKLKISTKLIIELWTINFFDYND
jgi:hypothetical protein